MWVLLYGVGYTPPTFPMLLVFFSTISTTDPTDCKGFTSLTFTNQITNLCGWNSSPILAAGGYYATGGGGSAIITP